MTDQNEAAALDDDAFAAAYDAARDKAEELQDVMPLTDTFRAFLTAYKQALPAAPGVLDGNPLFDSRNPNVNRDAPSAPLASTEDSEQIVRDLRGETGDTCEFRGTPSPLELRAADLIERLQAQLASTVASGGKCPECHGTGRIDNHVTGEVECVHCDGTGLDLMEEDAAPVASTVAAPGAGDGLLETLRQIYDALCSDPPDGRAQKDVYRDHVIYRLDGQSMYQAINKVRDLIRKLEAAPTPVAASGPTLGSEALKAFTDHIRADRTPTSAGPSLVAAETEACARVAEQILGSMKVKASLGPKATLEDVNYIIAQAIKPFASTVARNIRARIPSDALAVMEAERQLAKAAVEVLFDELHTWVDGDTGNWTISDKAAQKIFEYARALRDITPQGEAKTEGKDV